MSAICDLTKTSSRFSQIYSIEEYSFHLFGLIKFRYSSNNQIVFRIPFSRGSNNIVNFLRFNGKCQTIFFRKVNQIFVLNRFAYIPLPTQSKKRITSFFLIVCSTSLTGNHHTSRRFSNKHSFLSARTISSNHYINFIICLYKSIQSHISKNLVSIHLNRRSIIIHPFLHFQEPILVKVP